MKYYFLFIIMFMQNIHAELTQSAQGDQTKNTFSVGQPQKISVTKLFYHKGNLSDRLIFYFDNKPLWTYHPTKENNATRQSVELFLPMSTIKDAEIRKIVDSINKSMNNSYKIMISDVKMPLPGLKVIVNYDCQHILCEYAPHYSISAQNCLIISMHHKKKLETLAVKSEKILHTVSLKSPAKPKIMLDFGHGGRDDGKVAADAIKEKDINLQVGTKVAQLLRSRGYDVELTRSNDIFLPLDIRTLLANKQKAHIFISIHANSAPSSDVTGIETYWSSRSFCPTKFVCTKKNEQIVKTVMNKLDAAHKLLADTIHNHVIQNVRNKFDVADRKTRESLAQVLIGTDMPSALIEIGFLSSPVESKKLQDSHYQLLIAHGISKGIEDYCTTIFA